MLKEYTTRNGYKFWGESFVVIDGKDYPMDEMSEEQRDYVGTMLNVQGLNAYYAGERVYRAEGLRPFEEVFPEIAADRAAQKASGT